MSDEKTEQQDGHAVGGNPAAEAAGISSRPSDEVIAEIEEERERRLAPENRPDNTEIDNTDKVLVDGELIPQDEVDDDAEIEGGTLKK